MSQTSDRIQPDTRDNYAYWLELPTRWNDNDVYGHINNAVYYEYFDTVVNRWLIENDLLHIGESETIGLVVETACSYFTPLTFPEAVTAGLRIAHVGNSSVRYEVGLFGKDNKTAARGHFVHVYVDEKTRRPSKISDKMKDKLREISR